MPGSLPPDPRYRLAFRARHDPHSEISSDASACFIRSIDYYDRITIIVYFFKLLESIFFKNASPHNGVFKILERYRHLTK